MADVFISYRALRRPAAQYLAETLRNYGYSVWFDYGLLSGTDFSPVIERELREARAVLVLWCRHSRDRKWVLNEARMAERRGTLLSTRLEDVELPLDFYNVHTLDLCNWNGDPRSPVLDTLLSELAQRVGREPQINFMELKKQSDAWRMHRGVRLADMPLDEPMDERMEQEREPAKYRAPPAVDPGLDGARQAYVAKEALPPKTNSRHTLIWGVGGVTLVAVLAGAWFALRPPAAEAPPLADVPASAAVDADPAFLQCEQLAGAPTDARRSRGIAGVRLEAINATEAIAACRQAVVLAPDNPTLRFDLGRALDSAGQYEEAYAELMAAVQQNYAAAQNHIGVLYSNGTGPEHDEAEAVSWFRLAAEQADGAAQANLGIRYLYGTGGVTVDPIEARRLLLLAALKGVRAAQFGLGIIYLDGREGIPANEREAVQWLRHAAEAGEPGAQHQLGEMYRAGRGFDQPNEVEATRWFLLAADQGYEPSQQALAQ